MSEQVTITIDGRELSARRGELLRAALRNEIFPSLCLAGDRTSGASCRLCYVEIEGRERPVTSYRAGYRRYGVHTRSPRVDRLVASALN